MTTRQTVRIFAGALAEYSGDVVLRGLVSPPSFPNIGVDSYQREAFPATMLKSITTAFLNEDLVPDIELGMRGSKCDFSGSNFALQDPVYVIDGQQRLVAAMQAMQENPELTIRLGAVVFFNTTYKWEQQRFLKLNGPLRRAVSPNVLLRNMKDSNRMLQALHTLSTTDKAFPLYGRVCWDQRMKRTHLVSARSLLTIAFMLHTGATVSGSIDTMVSSLSGRMEKIGGVAVFRRNMQTFFEVINQCWNVESVQYRERATFLRTMFLSAVARVFYDHSVFWSGDVLTVQQQDRRKLGSFKIQDPFVTQLASAGGSMSAIMYQVLLEHLKTRQRARFRERGDLSESSTSNRPNLVAGEKTDRRPHV